MTHDHDSQHSEDTLLPSATSTGSFSDEPLVIPVIQETMQVGTRIVETGKVHISKKVTEETAVENFLETSEQITVERKQINQYVETAPPASRQEGDVTIISVVKEVLFVEKRLMLVEELHVTKHKVQENKKVTATLRKEEVTVERKSTGTEI
jgi:uncharacterized protein (TIGR02271 family)